MKIKNILIVTAGLFSLAGLVQCTHYAWKEIRLSPEEKQDYEFCFSTHLRSYTVRLHNGIQTVTMESWGDGMGHYLGHAGQKTVKKTRRLPQPNKRLNQLIMNFVQMGSSGCEYESDYPGVKGLCLGIVWKSGTKKYSWNLLWEEVQEKLREPYNELNLYLYLSNPQWNQYPEAFPLLTTEPPPHVSPQSPGNMRK